MAKEDPSRAGQTLAANIDAEKKPRFWGGGGVYFLKKRKNMDQECLEDRPASFGVCGWSHFPFPRLN